jgi:4-hydroxy-tetrahydrodipicolinate reductase
MLNLCVAGATGRMGVAIIQEARAKGIMTVGAIEAPGSPSIGKTLRELAITDQDTCILSSEEIARAVKDADVYISFTSPAAEMQNIPAVVKLGKRVVLGTTGFTPKQNSQIRSALEDNVPAVFSPNYSVGVNILSRKDTTLA